MSVGGWIVMIVSITLVTVPFFWCMVKVLSTPRETEKLHGFDRHTPDEE